VAPERAPTVEEDSMTGDETVFKSEIEGERPAVSEL
jgi:hypothetical protein